MAALTAIPFHHNQKDNISKTTTTPIEKRKKEKFNSHEIRKIYLSSLNLDLPPEDILEKKKKPQNISL